MTKESISSLPRNDQLASRSLATWASKLGKGVALLGVVAVTLSASVVPAVAAKISGKNGTTIAIPDKGDFMFSSIELEGAPKDAVVKGIDVTFEYAHPFANQLNIDLNADGLGDLGTHDLWARKTGPGGKSVQVIKGITTFDGIPANRTWYLYLRDEVSGGAGALKQWSIVVNYVSADSPDAPAAAAAKLPLPEPAKAKAEPKAPEVVKEAAAKPKGPAPVVASVGPAPVTGMRKAQPITVTGKNFDCKANVTLGDLTRKLTFPKREMSSCSSTKIVLNPNFTERPADWYVEVINPDGGSSGRTSFKVLGAIPSPPPPPAAVKVAPTPPAAKVAPKRDPAAGPGITGVSPNPVPAIDKPQGFTISGAGFDCPVRVTLRDLTRDYTFPKRPVQSCSRTQIIIAPNFSSTPGEWGVEVTNKDRKRSGLFKFSVKAGKAN
jgi:subtilisin-like proprotein convertase family protein